MRARGESSVLCQRRSRSGVPRPSRCPSARVEVRGLQLPGRGTLRRAFRARGWAPNTGGAGGCSVRLPTRGITRLQPEWVWAAQTLPAEQIAEPNGRDPYEYSSGAGAADLILTLVPAAARADSDPADPGADVRHDTAGRPSVGVRPQTP